MPLKYHPRDPEDVESEGGDYPPLEEGDYQFKVDTAEEVIFKSSGNDGLKLKLLVGYKNGRDVPCFVNLPYIDKMQWKLKHFLESIGFDYSNPPDAWEVVGKKGLAYFTVNEKGYFDVKDFEPVEPMSHVPAKKPAEEAKKTADGDNLPF